MSIKNAGLYFAIIILLLIGCQQKSPQIKKSDNQTETKNQESKVDTKKSDTVFKVSSLDDFIGLFRERKSLPDSEELFKSKLTEDSVDAYRNFGWYYQQSLCGNYSDIQWIYKPLYKVKVGEDYFLFMVRYEPEEYQQEARVYREDFVFTRWGKKYSGQIGMKFQPITIGIRQEDKILQTFHFVDNDPDRINLNNENEESINLQFFGFDYFNVKNSMILSNKKAIHNYSIDEVFSLVSSIDDSWSTAKALKEDAAKKDSLNRELSAYFHLKTKFTGEYINDEEEVVPILNFLGGKVLSDSIYLIIWKGLKDFDSHELNLCLFKDFDNEIETISVPYNDKIQNDITVRGDKVFFNTSIKGKSNINSWRITELGFDYNDGFILKEFSKYEKLSTPLNITQEWLKTQEKMEDIGVFGTRSIMGQIETKTKRIVLVYDGGEITSGSHSYSEDVFGKVFDKETGLYQGRAKYYMMFSDANELTESSFDGSLLIHEHVNDEISGDPGNTKDTLFLTNYGFSNRNVLAVETYDSNKKWTDFYNETDTLRLEWLSSYQIGEYEFGSKEKMLSQFIHHAKFYGKPSEAYCPICIPLGRLVINDSNVAYFWSRETVKNREFYSNLDSQIEFAIVDSTYDQNTIIIKELPNWIDTKEELENYLYKYLN